MSILGKNKKTRSGVPGGKALCALSLLLSPKRRKARV